MPDHYCATIQMWPWHNDDPRTQAVAHWLTENYGPLQEEDGSELIGNPIVSADGKLSLEVEEACEGLDEFTEAGSDPTSDPSLVDLLKAAELTFVARDAGRYGCGSREISWRPGLAELRERPLVAGGVPALSQPVAEMLLEVSADDRLRASLRNYFAPIEGYATSERVEEGTVTTEAVVGESDAGAPQVLFASPGAEVLVVPAFLEDEHDVYSPEDVLEVVGSIESLNAFAWSDELKALARDLRKTARDYAAEA
jgi:hypothetical protein